MHRSLCNHLRHNSNAAQSSKDEPAKLDTGTFQTIQKNDQCFLMYFLIGVHFGPDLKDEVSPKSALQRLTEGLPAYNSGQLRGSHMSVQELELKYCSLARKSSKTVGFDLSAFLDFLQGNIPIQDGEEASSYLQFPDLFPAYLHRFSEPRDGRQTVENIVYIENPEASYLKPGDIERFKRIAGQDDFWLLGNSAQEEPQSSAKDIQCYKRKRRMGSDSESSPAKPARKDALPNVTPISQSSEPTKGPAMVVLPSQPNAEVLDGIVALSKNGYALTGSAVKGQVGPVIGLMDIGEAENSYLFRVALPGVKREGRSFRCEVETDGKVLIKGETVTGEKWVRRFSQVFEMQTQNLCPPGPFSVSFRLPGPVDHRQFMGSFGTDGILEGVVMKAGKRVGQRG